MATTQIQGMNILVYVKDKEGQKIALGGQNGENTDLLLLYRHT